MATAAEMLAGYGNNTATPQVMDQWGRAWGDPMYGINPVAKELFDLYVTGSTPDKTALKFWSDKIADVGYEEAMNQFLVPADPNAPRMKIMSQDEDYLRVTGKAPPPAVNKPPANQAPANPAPVNTGPAKQLFDLYATGFAPDQAAFDFWNERIATVGFDNAKNEFLNPTWSAAPRLQTMLNDPDYRNRYGTNAGTNPGGGNTGNTGGNVGDTGGNPISAAPPTGLAEYYYTDVNGDVYYVRGGQQTKIGTARPQGTQTVTNAGGSSLPGEGTERKIATGQLPQRIMIGGAPVTLGGGFSAYPYATQAYADQLGIPMLKLQDVISMGMMPSNLVAAPTTSTNLSFQRITNPANPFVTAAGAANPYANTTYANPWFVNADTLNPYGLPASGAPGGVTVTPGLFGPITGGTGGTTPGTTNPGTTPPGANPPGTGTDTIIP